MFLIKFLNSISYKSSFNFVFADQVIVSMGNFLLTILIVKFLGIKTFGLFSYFWIFLLLINSIQLSYIISPMLTNAPKQRDSIVSHFYGGVFYQQLLFSIIISFSIFFVFKLFGNFIISSSISNYCLSFSLMIILTQLQQFLRRLLFSKRLFLRPIISDLCTYLFLISFISYLNYLNKLDLGMIFWAFVFSFAIGTMISVPVIFSLNYKFKNMYTSIKKNWIIGKWMLLTSLVQWFAGNLWIVNAGLILGAYTLGVIRACQSIVNVANLLFQSLENIVPRQTSKIFKLGDTNNMRIFLKKFSLKGTFVVIIMSSIIILFSKFLLNIFYGIEMVKHYQILVFLSLILPLTFLQYPSMYGLRTMGKTKPIFISFLSAAVIAILFSNIVITYFGLNGLIIGLFFHQLIILSFIYIGYIYYLKKFKNES